VYDRKREGEGKGERRRIQRERMLQNLPLHPPSHSLKKKKKKLSHLSYPKPFYHLATAARSERAKQLQIKRPEGMLAKRGVTNLERCTGYSN
jgi:hypothetical protein